MKPFCKDTHLINPFHLWLYYLFRIVLAHHFQSKPRYRWLKVCLFRIDHYAEVKLLRNLFIFVNYYQSLDDFKRRTLNTHRNDGVQPPNHVSEHLFFLRCELSHESNHFSRLDIGYLEGLAKLVVLIEYTAPWEQVNNTVRKTIIQNFYWDSAVSWFPSLSSALRVSIRSSAVQFAANSYSSLAMLISVKKIQRTYYDGNRMN